jgi:DNA-binding response OmpR family regulator
MTAWSHDDRIRAALDEGVLAVLPKPLEVPKLLARLATVLEGTRALVVEDDTALAANLAELLTERGFSVRVAHAAADARRIAGASPPAVALVDWRLPDGDGLELVDDLCRVGSCTAVVFSGHARELADPGGRTQARGAHFLEKPIDLRRLLAIVGPAGKR